jgi:hypothetical protein
MMQKPPSGHPGNGQDLDSGRPNLLEAVVRQPTRRFRTARPAVADGASGSTENSQTAGIHAVTSSPTHQSDESSSERKGPSGVAPVKQEKKGHWRDSEIEELRRLVGIHTDPTGTVSWVKVTEAWINQNMPVRSKASLCSKWYGIRSKPAAVLRDDSTVRTRVSVVPNQDVLPGEASPISIAKGVAEPEAMRECERERESERENGCEREKKRERSPEAISTVFDKHLRRARKIGCEPHMRRPPTRVSGKNIGLILREIDELVSRKVGSNPTWNQLSIAVYAGAMTASTIGNRLMSEKLNRAREWFRSSYREMDSLRKTIGKASTELARRTCRTQYKESPTMKQVKNIRMLAKDHKAVSYVEITSLVERLKSRLLLLQARVELRKADERRIRVRQMPSKVLLRDVETEQSSQILDPKQVRRYWKTIVGQKKDFNPQSSRLKAWKDSLLVEPEEGDLTENLTLELWQKVLHKAKPWKACGPDGLQSFWWKAFPSAGTALYHLCVHHLSSGEPLPHRWIAEGRVVVIHKSGSRLDPANYRPIACLNTCYKLLTGFVAKYLDLYLRKRKIIPEEQIALRGGVWGCTHALTLDQSLSADAQNQKQRPISVAWIDYAKAFDSVPHSYVTWLFNAVRAPGPIKKFLSGLMRQWRVRYEIRNPRGKALRSSHLRISSGVLQGDSFSPLLFCLAMAPISHAVNSIGGEYKTASGKLKGLQVSLSHLFYMDDLKLFACSPKNLQQQIEVVASISNDINMRLNAKKCAVAHFTPSRLRNAQVGVETPALTDGNASFPTLESGAFYKYLGIEQRLGLNETEAWDRVEEKCCKTFRRIYESELTFRQKVNMHNTNVIPTLSYIVSCMIKGCGKYASVLERGEKLDKKFRKILTEHKSRYKASCVARLYLTAEKGGCGLKSVKDSLEESTIYSWAYLCTKPELRGPLNLFVSMSNRSKRSLVSDAESVMKSYNLEVELDEAHSTVIMNGVHFTEARALARHIVDIMRTENNTRRYKKWQELALAGRVLRTTSNIDLHMSFAWLRAGRLSAVAVRNTLAAQEGCLLTKAHPALAKGSNDTRCRACGTTTETIEHVVSSCSKWLSNLYIDRHDSVARNIHYRLCQRYGLTPPHYSQKVDQVMENEEIKLYWNQPVQTKNIIRHNKPDMVLYHKPEKTVLIIEVAVSWFTGIVRQIEIKRNRYCVNGNWQDEMITPYPPGENLLREFRVGGWKPSFLPVVIGATGEVHEDLLSQIKAAFQLTQESAEQYIERLQRSAVLGTSRIIKNHLAVVSHDL